LAHKGVFTNTAPVDAYRGAGRPEACYVVERLVDRAAREMKIDPTELRRRNFVANDAFPYTTRVALTYDSGDYFKTLDMVVEAADYAGFEQRRQEAASRGKLRGIGVATYIEACAMAPSVLAGQLGARAGFYESAEVRVHPTGSITVFTGAHSHGQGHETTFAQLVSERLGLAFDQIDIVHGDTAKIPFGMGTYASRSLAVGGTALVKAMDKIVNKGKKIAAHMLEAPSAAVRSSIGRRVERAKTRSTSFSPSHRKRTAWSRSSSRPGLTGVRRKVSIAHVQRLVSATGLSSIRAMRLISVTRSIGWTSKLRSHVSPRSREKDSTRCLVPAFGGLGRQ
jgi:carbon-monoxide dehydrogenase large subunit